jgi:hypothetical protein
MIVEALVSPLFPLADIIHGRGRLTIVTIHLGWGWISLFPQTRGNYTAFLSGR